MAGMPRSRGAAARSADGDRRMGLAILERISSRLPRDPWNPWITVLPFAFCSVCGGGVGRRLGVCRWPFHRHFPGASTSASCCWPAGSSRGGLAAWRNGSDADVDDRNRSRRRRVPTDVLDQLFGREISERSCVTSPVAKRHPAGFVERSTSSLANAAGRGSWFDKPEPVDPSARDTRRKAPETSSAEVAFAGAGMVRGLRAMRQVRLQITVAVAVVMGFVSVSRISDGVRLSRPLWGIRDVVVGIDRLAVLVFIAHHIRVLREVK